MDTTKFSEWLAERMAERGETKYKLAKSLGISQSTPASWLKGSHPNIGYRRLLAEHYGVAMEDIP